jgi:hypothetical protein
VSARGVDDRASQRIREVGMRFDLGSGRES